jgi:hypothetical protein
MRGRNSGVVASWTKLSLMYSKRPPDTLKKSLSFWISWLDLLYIITGVMRLLHTREPIFREFFDETPRYAILSHR